MELELLVLVVLGFAVGTYGTIIGLGGGFVLVPILLFIYPDYGPEEISSISLAVVFANTVSGSVAYARQGRIDYRTGLIFAAASAPGVVAGALVVHAVPQRLFILIFAFLLLALAFVTLRRRPQHIRPPLAGPGVLRRSVYFGGRTYVYANRIWQGALLSLGVGFLSSLLGIGGGAIHVPAMIIWLHFPVEIAIATSQFILAFMSGGGTAVHLSTGTLAGEGLTRALALGVGTIPGAQVGAQIAKRLRPRQTLFLLSIALFGLSAGLLVRGVFDI
jgi:uncharacterized membrane protein YfcA